MSLLKVSQTAVFGQIVARYMEPPPPAVPPETGCADVVALMRASEATVVLVEAPDGRRLGLVTEQDVVRRMAFRADAHRPVGEVMTRGVTTIVDDDFVFHAIAKMRRAGFRHMPVVDRDGRVCGLLHLHRALAATVPRLLDLIDRLTHEATLAGLARVKAAQVELAEALLADRVPVPDIQGLLTHINNDIYRRIVARLIDTMDEEGWGRPPVEFDVIVMGSGGRGESFLFPDQDNGFVLADHEPARRASVDAFFIELAERMTRDLDHVGFRLCNGHVMATNPLWRKTLREWCEQVSVWLRRPRAATLRLCDIFFDYRPVHGRGSLAGTLRAHISEALPAHHHFLREMQRVQQDHGVALGLFNRLAPDHTPGPHRGKLNLKYQALLPLVETVRLLALRAGVAETGTLARIERLREREVLDADLQDYLGGAFHHVTDLVLRQQIRDFQAGRPVGAYVAPEALSERERDLLVDCLKAIEELRGRVRSEFTGAIV